MLPCWLGIGSKYRMYRMFVLSSACLVCLFLVSRLVRKCSTSGLVGPTDTPRRLSFLYSTAPVCINVSLAFALGVLHWCSDAPDSCLKSQRAPWCEDFHKHVIELLNASYHGAAATVGRLESQNPECHNLCRKALIHVWNTCKKYIVISQIGLKEVVHS